MQNRTEFLTACWETKPYLFRYVTSYEHLYLSYVRCHNDVISSYLRSNVSGQCVPEFDCFTCWPPTSPNAAAVTLCPSYVQMFNNATNFVSRQCAANGTWAGEHYIDYGDCVDPQKTNTGPIYLFIAGYAVSMLLLVVAVFILAFFRQLRCDRNQIHLNLFASFILNGLAWIVYFCVLTFNPPILDANPGWCQALHVLCQYLSTCNFFWMFCEGFFLHTVLVLAFHTGKNLLISVYLVGWVAPLPLAFVYGGLRANSAADSRIHCWVNFSKLQWINYGPIVASIVLNMLFLGNIVRVIVTKLRAFDVPSDDTSTHTRKAVRATVILIPLLGLQFILMPVRPDPGTVMDEVYHYAVAAIISLQGACVAMIYCFCNGEVLAVLRRRWMQLRPLKAQRAASRGMSGNTTTTYTENIVHNPRESACTSDIKDLLELQPLNNSAHTSPV